MNPADPDNVLRTLATSLGLGPGDLRRIADQLHAPAVPTVAEFAPFVLERYSDKSRPTYAVSWRHTAAAASTTFPPISWRNCATTFAMLSQPPRSLERR